MLVVCDTLLCLLWPHLFPVYISLVCEVLLKDEFTIVTVVTNNSNKVQYIQGIKYGTMQLKKMSSE